jgi:hypothetical protein
MHRAPHLWARHSAPPAAPVEEQRLLERLREALGGDGARIRCPLCRWRPRPSDAWGCRCGHAWNTFDTRGRCPRCEYQWRHTQCLRCHVFSLHEDWYAPEGEGEGAQ